MLFNLQNYVNSSIALKEIRVFFKPIENKNKSVPFPIKGEGDISDLDSRQMITMLKVAKEKTSLHDYQYILSLNEANLKGVQELLSPEEYKALVTDNIILELTDESNTGKLLGIQVDLKYSKE